MSLFSSYKVCIRNSAITASALVMSYIDDVSTRQVQSWADAQVKYSFLMPLFEKIFSITATSAPVERVFSQSGLLMRPNRARMGDKLLSQLVFTKCNKHL
jgi:hypothetical protein